ncbi:ABC transporter ATP-binding protein [Bacillus manliponensis]|uniref:ABC transporter ATP-binding protein n=1 Tax=Bacillus manliponensis TaxID=574376 RepID=UPI0035183D70
MEHILEIEQLRKSYPNSSFELKNISFSVPYGSIVGFIGENGAGKTTTMGTIIGGLKKDSGYIKVLGEEIDDHEIENRENIGVVFDDMSFAGNLDVHKLSKVMRNIYQQWKDEKFFYYIRKFSLPKNQKIKSFSRGMSMKLSIAVALSHEPKLLILDEATSGLDPVVREEILDVFLEFVKDKKHSILLSSHIISDIQKAADQLVFIKKGEIILTVDKEKLLNNYGIVTCEKSEFYTLDKSDIVTYKQSGEYVEVLVSNKNSIPAGLTAKSFSIDDITMLLLKGEK